MPKQSVESGAKTLKRMYKTERQTERVYRFL